MLARINVYWEPDMHHMRYHLVDGFVYLSPPNELESIPNG